MLRFTDRTVVVLVACCALLATAGMSLNAGAAPRKILRGTTGQGASLTLVIGTAGRPTRFSFGWEARCGHGGRFRDGTNTLPRGRHATSDFFSLSGSYRGRERGGYRFLYRIAVNGTRDAASGTWRGTFRGSVRIRRHGKPYDRCVLKRTVWSATPPKPRQPQPLPVAPTAPPTQDQEPTYAPTRPSDPEPGLWRLELHGDAGDQVSGPLPYDATFEPPADRVAVGYGEQRVTFTVRNDRENWSATIGAQRGTDLTARTYPDARDSRDEAHPELYVSGRGEGCGGVTGSFTISAIRFDEWGRLLRLKVSFEQHCHGAIPALRGTFDYQAS